MNKPHEVSLGKNAKLSCFEAFRPQNTHGKNQKTSRPVDLTPCPVMVLPIGKATRFLQEALEKQLDVKLAVSSGHLNVNGLTLVSKTLCCDQFQLDLLFPHNFPCVAPLALFIPAYRKAVDGRRKPSNLPGASPVFKLRRSRKN